jgi:death-on-curing protein
VTLCLTAEQVLFIHYRLVSETGGKHGVRDLGFLESLINNHPFVDGNKHTGIACAVLFLQQNGISFSAKNTELEKFTLRVASSRAERSEIPKWLKKHSH